jgi:hypothetical protein
MPQSVLVECIYNGGDADLADGSVIDAILENWVEIYR